MYRFIILSVCSLFLGLSSSAQAANVAVGVNAGSLGYGAEVSTQLLDGLAMRLGGNYFSYSEEEVMDGIAYDMEATLQTAGLIFDWHPLANGWRLSFGAKYNGNEMEATATPTTNKDIGNNNFTPAQIGTLTAKVTFDEFAPYVGLGYDNAFYSESKWSFWGDFGVMYQGDPKLELTATGSIATTNEAELEQEEKDAQDDLSEFNMYPVIAAGVTYRF
ncbi:MAG: hypothetical protein ACTSXQ_06945 [Alphaproteobacteria bacterium]